MNEGHGDGASRLTHIANPFNGYTFINGKASDIPASHRHRCDFSECSLLNDLSFIVTSGVLKPF
ncbi:hypothetical protein ACIQD3_00215 [Peribacillus loiseleuriae]|uniref:hypothetical protein n=1 Tax=Peribacillus loiseleuriae TaxID=1679170 RepID=UPI00381C7A00